MHNSQTTLGWHMGARKGASKVAALTFAFCVTLNADNIPDFNRPLATPTFLALAVTPHLWVDPPDPPPLRARLRNTRSPSDQTT